MVHLYGARLSEAFGEIRELADAAKGCTVLVLVAPDVDAICASAIIEVRGWRV